VGKSLYLRSGYLDNSLNFNEHGMLVGTRHRLLYAERGGNRKGAPDQTQVGAGRGALRVAFLGALPYEDPTKAVDRVRITPKKKMLRITLTANRW